jgi:hypothetical protein
MIQPGADGHPLMHAHQLNVLRSIIRQVVETAYDFGRE